MYVASIHIYPVKATRALGLGEAAVQRWGLAGDRRWMLTDGGGRFISQREEPAMALVRVIPRPGSADTGSAGITVAAPGCPPLDIAAPAPGGGTGLVPVTVWGSALAAAAAGPAADRWFRRYLGRPDVALVYLDDPARRPVDPAFGAPGDRVSFADGYPLLLTAQASLAELGEWLDADGEAPVPMSRFRPSVVVAGSAPWAEDGWRELRIGAVPFRVVKPCDRCVVTTIDQDTAERGRQPLHMLGRKRRFGAGLLFGQNLIPDGTGTIRVGDQVSVQP